MDTADFGLMFYRAASRATKWRVDNARWYDPALGRFAQADTIVPGGVQGQDRYTYTNNNPILYTDPSGHGVDCGFGMGGVNDPPQNTGGGGDEGDGDEGDEEDDTLEIINDKSPGLNSPASEITCGSGAVRCERYEDILILYYNGEKNTINLANVTSATDIIAINDFIRLADQQDSSWTDFVNNMGVAVATTVTALGGWR